MKIMNFSSRQESIQETYHEVYDLAVIGGGITGAGIARDAASRGMKVILIEAKDFSSGTSSKSSKLIHGGIRYLENFEFKLVFEALSERSRLFEMAPHLVHHLRFMIPIFQNSRVGMFKMGLGMWLYDLLSLFQAPKLHQNLSSEETLHYQPEVNSKDLVGSFIYSDAYMDDDRLTIETLRSANEFGARIINYTQVVSHRNSESQVHTLECMDQLEKKSFYIKAKNVFSAVGPWTDFVGRSFTKNWESVLRPTKGIHLVISRKKLPLNQAVVMGAEKGNRIIFGIPRGESVILGTTDTDYQQDPHDVRTTNDEVNYLIEIVNNYFPGSQLKKQDIISSYSGVRPLVKDKSDTTGKTSREHLVFQDEQTKVFYIAGGKYTTYRKMAEDAVKKIIATLSFEDQFNFRESNTLAPLNSLITKQSYYDFLDQEMSPEEKKIAEKYGPEWQYIKNNYFYETTLQQEAAFAIDSTLCLFPSDFFLRRTNLVLTHRDHGFSKYDEVAQVFKERLNLNENQIESDFKLLKSEIEKEMSWKNS